MTTTPAGRTAINGFVPTDLDATRWNQIEPLAAALLDRPVHSAAEFERWLLDRSELDASCSESRANLYIAMTCRTDDAATNAAWAAYLDEVPPRLKPFAFELDKKQVELSKRFPLDAARYGVLMRDTAVEVELFRPENVPLETELAKLDQKYDQICGEMTVEFGGQTRTLAQMARHLQETDRDVRERAWRGIFDRRLRDKDEIDAIFDRMIALRDSVARNAGFTTYRDYAFKERHRFDYGVKESLAFHSAIQTHAVPFLRRLNARRQKALGVEALRPWDLNVDEKGREPLRPFASGQDLLDKTQRVYDAMDPWLASAFRGMGPNERPGGCLDLDSRKGKASGGYQYMRDRSRRPFIFMNAAGLHRDVQTMVHEAGHMFHSMLCVDEPLVAYRHSPIEFAEVASMSMELLTMPHWQAYYPDETQRQRARREQLEGAVSILPWIATIDAFQHWVYTNPTHTREQRNAYWLTLDERFGAAVSWDGLDPHREYQWQKQGHLFGNPFYYIEYGIAQLGALGLWLMSLENGTAAALAAYKRALSLGGSRPLPELFAAAGLPFDFGDAIVGRIVRAVERELENMA